MKTIAKVMMVALVVVVAISLSACGCRHEKVIDAAVPASCTRPALSEGKHCALCDKVFVEQEEIAPALGHNEVIIKAVEPDCTSAGATEGKKCSTCGKILVSPKEVAALGHTTTTGTCTRCNTSFGAFIIKNYVDEFNMPTSNRYVTNDDFFYGSMSNSATSGSKLYARILADKLGVAIMLFEYGNQKVKNSRSYEDDYEITLRTSNGQKYSLTGTMYSGGDRIFIDSKYENTVLDALKSGETISFYIKFTRYTTTTYLFSVETSNFKELYKELTGK